MKKWLRRIVAVLAVGYPASLLACAVLLHTMGESWWMTGVALYLPRIGFALPLPLLVIALLVSRLYWLLLTQLAALVVLLFPLMGLVLSLPAVGHKDAPIVRVMSFNVDSGYFGYDKVDAEIGSFSPDIVALQEVFLEPEKIAAALRSRYPIVEISTQFVIASRFPIVVTSDPDRLPFYGRLRSPRFMRYVVETPIGRIALYNLHPVSPRGAFYELRGAGLRREILSGRIFSGAAGQDFVENCELRAFQVQTAAALAAGDRYPAVIAGDLNLPGLSPIYARNLSRFQDGFAEVGWGFGYTFQSYRPWMRLDRILASDELRFARFQVACKGASDHLCVVADLERRER